MIPADWNSTMMRLGINVMGASKLAALLSRTVIEGSSEIFRIWSDHERVIENAAKGGGDGSGVA
jgi:hypothetical protein